MRIPQKRLTFFTAATIILLTLIMLQLTGLIPAWGNWYSYDLPLRLQSEAFMRWELAIQPVPYGHGPDWAWGNGMQQVWGLGVPLIQLPFQMLGKLCNDLGFPDRLIFLISYTLVATLFWIALDGASNDQDRGMLLKRRLVTLPILLYAFLNHALINMIQGKYERYEEVISYAFLWSLMLFALLAIFLRKRHLRLYLLICLLAGFALNLRPTIGAYGGITFVLAFLAYRGKISFRLTGLVLYLAGIGFHLLMNDLRFGSPFESGHRLALTDTPISDYFVRFDNPMTWIPFTSAARELFSGLFFLDISSFYRLNGWLPGLVEVPRWREFNFKPYYPIEFILLLLSWSLVVVLWYRDKRLRPAPPDHEEQIVAVGLAWSFLSFALLFFFYARWPGLVSRYLVDFAPALIIAIASLYRYLITIRSSLPYRILFGTMLMGWTIIALSISEIIPIYGSPTTVTTREVVRERLKTATRTSGPPLPATYNCGAQEMQYQIPYNNSQWNLAGDCGVSLVTTHFLEQPECIEIAIAPFANAPTWLRKEYSDQEIELRVGTEPMQRVSEKNSGSGKDITFCRTTARHQGSSQYPPIEMISIKWFDLRKHPDLKTIPFALLSLGKVR